ncbi:MAG: hypothetical protein LBO06_02355 [Bacteroidales bacterium]|nr:hypothetical protein [Bacteroidales bacterium]
MKRFLKLTIFLLAVLCWQNADAQLRPEIKALRDSIASHNILESIALGEGGDPSIVYQYFKKLKNKATDDELRILIKDCNAVVRGYTFLAFLHNGSNDMFPILLEMIYDTATVETQESCRIGEEQVGSYCLFKAGYRNSLWYLNTNQTAIIDSILIFDKNIKSYQKNNLLRRLTPDKKYYTRIREIADEERNPSAIIALARYKNENDIEIIKTFFDDKENEYYAVYAAREFPDTAFYPYLVSIFERLWANDKYDYQLSHILCQALAKYPTKQTCKLFNRIKRIKLNYKDDDDDGIFKYETWGVCMLAAFIKYPNPIFEPIKQSINFDFEDEEGKLFIEDEIQSAIDRTP